MYQTFFKNFPHMTLPVAGELIFFVVFLFVLFWVLSKKNDAYFSYLANIPLRKENEYE